jgi:hypothetical protein
MDDQHAGQLAGGVRWFGQIAFDRARAGGRRVAHHLGLDALVVFGDLLPQRKIGAQGGQQRRCGHAGRGEFLGAFQKTPPVQGAVHIGIKQNQQFLVKVLGGLAFHDGSCKKIQHTDSGARWQSL